MSRLIPPKYNSKEKQIQFINSIVHNHDFLCGCQSPLECTILLIHNQEKHLRFTKEEKQKLQQWLGTTTKEEEEEDFGDGVLESLFSTDFGEKEDTAKEDG